MSNRFEDHNGLGSYSYISASEENMANKFKDHPGKGLLLKKASGRYEPNNRFKGHPGSGLIAKAESKEDTLSREKDFGGLIPLGAGPEEALGELIRLNITAATKSSASTAEGLGTRTVIGAEMLDCLVKKVVSRNLKEED